ncbi:MAG: tRNA 2-thiocytidine biosynthesis protein TtcA [Epulopiscium sp.]|nr:tRNA 2-thiocytidine biosynthesis protein TtcA [Candidatus Epulonipiscium sp.]
MERYKLIERSIIKKFRKNIWQKFLSSINDYSLIEKDDKIAVCISGGKDSMLLAKCMQEIQRHGNIPFELEFLVMDPGYNKINRQMIIENAKILDIPIKVFETEIFNIVSDIEKSPCYLCARMRRGYLYNNAKLLGCNKIALGHHFDDVIETILMSMLYSGQFKTMMPKLHSSNFEGMELIRPLFLVKEKDIIAWSNYNDLKFIQCACRFTEDYENEKNAVDSKRAEMKELIKDFRKTSPYIEANIFQSIHNVNLETIIGYKDKDGYHSFLDNY